MAVRRKNTRKPSRRIPDTVIRKRAFRVFLFFFFIVSAAVSGKVLLNRVVFFPVADIEIVGNRHLSDREVFGMTRLKKGVSILFVSSMSVVKNLERSPWIKEASLRKELPDKIIIRIREAVPTALLKKDRDYYLLGLDGEILEKQAAGEKFLPVIKGDGKDERTLREAVRFAEVLKQYNGDTTTDSEILINDIEDMTLKHGAMKLKVGYGDYEDKLLRYLELRDEITRRGIPAEYIDLRYKNRVVVKTSAGAGY